MSIPNKTQFVINIPYLKNNMSECVHLKTVQIHNDVETLINPLKQKELAEGWIQILPNNINNNNNNKKFINMNINLAKLPAELWNKLDKSYKSYNNVIVNRIYKYFINETPVDNEIKELYNIINNFNDSHIDRTLEILQILEDNNISGWVIIKAKKLIGSKIELL